jgi:hypothetical protein
LVKRGLFCQSLENDAEDDENDGMMLKGARLNWQGGLPWEIASDTCNRWGGGLSLGVSLFKSCFASRALLAGSL